MRIKLRLDLNVPKNAGIYYSKSKESERKIEGAKKAIEETKRKIAEHKKMKSKEKQKIRVEKKWYEKFHYFFTESGKLVIGGKDATQNDIIFKKYMREGDLIYHSDIPGGALVVFEKGITAELHEKLEVAQFAISFSRAWRSGVSAADVYCFKKEQISKTPNSGEYIKKGSFIINGEKEWFKNTELKLKVGVIKKDVDGKELDLSFVYPFKSKTKLDKYLILKPNGHFKKGKASKSIAKYLKLDPNDIMPLLPNGDIAISKPK